MRRKTVLCGVPFPTRGEGSKQWETWRKGLSMAWKRGRKEEWCFVGEPVLISVEVRGPKPVPVPVWAYPTIEQILCEEEIISSPKMLVRDVCFRSAYAKQGYQSAVVTVERTK